MTCRTKVSLPTKALSIAQSDLRAILTGDVLFNFPLSNNIHKFMDIDINMYLSGFMQMK